MNSVSVSVQRLPHGEGLALPRYETEGAAGMDLIAAVPEALIPYMGGMTHVPA